MKTAKKGILIVLSVIAITFILCLLQYGIHYYNNPVEKEIHFTASGYIIWNPDNGKGEKVDVEVKGKSLSYIFKNPSGSRTRGYFCQWTKYFWNCG